MIDEPSSEDRAPSDGCSDPEVVDANGVNDQAPDDLPAPVASGAASTEAQQPDVRTAGLKLTAFQALNGIEFPSPALAAVQALNGIEFPSPALAAVQALSRIEFPSPALAAMLAHLDGLAARTDRPIELWPTVRTLMLVCGPLVVLQILIIMWAVAADFGPDTRQKLTEVISLLAIAASTIPVFKQLSANLEGRRSDSGD